MKDWDKVGAEDEALDAGLSGSEGEEVGEWWMNDVNGASSFLSLIFVGS